MRRIALLLEYDGAAYSGSQLQANASSIQGEVEAAIRRLTGEAVRLAVAGRTDAGVHAKGQVAAFTTSAQHDVGTFVRGLNALLPDDIAVRAAAEVDPGFDPRRDARGRVYRYTIWNAPERSPLLRQRAWHVRAPLDTAAMAVEAATLIGEHDFASFGGAVPPGGSTRRVVRRAEIVRRGPLVEFEIEANAFLPHQVRRTVGALVEAGLGRLPSGIFAEWLAAPRSGAAGPAAPPWGLCLVRVIYDESLIGVLGAELPVPLCGVRREDPADRPLRGDHGDPADLQ